MHPMSRAFAIVTALALLGLASLAAPAMAAPSASTEPDCQPSLAPGRHVLSLDVASGPREVIVQVPESTPGVRPPAVIAFHGYSSHAIEIEETSGLSDLADELGFVVAYPEALGDPTAWAYSSTSASDPWDVDLTDSLMTLLVEQACADPERLMLAGHSMGGGMVSDAACHLSGRVAGVVLLAALWLDPPCPPVQPVPVVATHALDDPVLPYSGGPLPGFGSGGPVQLAAEEAIGTWASYDGCGETPEVTESDDGSAVLTWPECLVPVVLHRLPSGGHDWPAISSELIVEMLQATAVPRDDPADSCGRCRP
jgi:polyhydroxybutyrate depolymerase